MASASEPLGAEWVLVADPAQRYVKPGRAALSDGATQPLGPFEALGLDSDPVPEPIDPEDVFRDRKIPEEAIDILQPNTLDYGHGTLRSSSALRGFLGHFHTELHPAWLTSAGGSGAWRTNLPRCGGPRTNVGYTHR